MNRFIFLLISLIITCCQIRALANDGINCAACKALEVKTLPLTQMIQNPEAFHRGDDSCVLALIDTLVYRYIREETPVYLDVLNAMANVSDGSVSEAMSYSCNTIFHNNPQSFIKYLSSHGSQKCALTRHTIYSLRDEKEDADNELSKRKEIIAFLDQNKKLSGFTKKELKLIDYLVSSIK